MSTREEDIKKARGERIEKHRQDLHDLLIKRDLIKKDAFKSIEEQKINQLKGELSV
jgi:hypothetical protein